MGILFTCFCGQSGFTSNQKSCVDWRCLILDISMNEMCGLMRWALVKGTSYPVMVMCVHACVPMCICVSDLYSALSIAR